MDPNTIIALIEEGVILIPKFLTLWGTLKNTFSTSDMQEVERALAKAIAQDEADTAQADADLAEAAKRGG